MTMVSATGQVTALVHLWQLMQDGLVTTPDSDTLIFMGQALSHCLQPMQVFPFRRSLKTRNVLKSPSRAP
jgi:hypothetical protein